MSLQTGHQSELRRYSSLFFRVCVMWQPLLRRGRRCVVCRRQQKENFVQCDDTQQTATETKRTSLLTHYCSLRIFEARVLLALCSLAWTKTSTRTTGS